MLPLNCKQNIINSIEFRTHRIVLKQTFIDGNTSELTNKYEITENQFEHSFSFIFQFAISDSNFKLSTSLCLI